MHDGVVRQQLVPDKQIKHLLYDCQQHLAMFAANHQTPDNMLHPILRKDNLCMPESLLVPPLQPPAPLPRPLFNLLTQHLNVGGEKFFVCGLVSFP